MGTGSGGSFDRNWLGVPSPGQVSVAGAAIPTLGRAAMKPAQPNIENLVLHQFHCEFFHNA